MRQDRRPACRSVCSEWPDTYKDNGWEIQQVETCLHQLGVLTAEVEVLRLVDLTFPQYNVLRILRGAKSAGLSCRTISERMLTRDSDLTRLLDRLEERGLVNRGRDERDRRISASHISEEGIRLLRKLDRPVERVHREHVRHMKPDQLQSLRALADLVRWPVP